MKLSLKRPLVIFDLETTGVSVTADRIVEICLLKVFPDGQEELRTYRVNPGIPIPKGASDVHGIYDADNFCIYFLYNASRTRALLANKYSSNGVLSISYKT